MKPIRKETVERWVFDEGVALHEIGEFDALVRLRFPNASYKSIVAPNAAPAAHILLDWLHANIQAAISEYAGHPVEIARKQ